MKLSRVLGLLLVGGCAAGPTTGQTFTGNTNGAVLSFFGYTDMAHAQVKAYALTDPYGDPAAGPYTFIGSEYTSSSATTGMNDPSRPAYYWSLNSNPFTTALWKPGGLVHLKTRSTFNGSSTPGDLQTFDDGGPACAYNEIQAGEKWWIAGQDCQTPYPNGAVITMTSTKPLPSDQNNGDIHYLQMRGGVYGDKCALASPASKVDETSHYYATIGAPATLAAFKTKYGFGVAGSNQVRAVYYNIGDLGIGRDMNCKTKALAGGVATACFVSNFGRAASPPFGGLGFGESGADPQDAINQALAPPGIQGISPNVPVATVAMVHDTSLPIDRRVQFMVYDGAGALTEIAPLDNAALNAASNQGTPTAANLNVPDNCLTCHGPSSSYTPSSVSPEVVHGARFLPFDPDNYLYSTSNASFNKAQTLPQLKKLNAFVWDTQPAAATVELLKGMYPSANSTGPKDAASVFNPDFVPAGWLVNTYDAKAAKQVYQKVVKPYCRTCHVADDSIDWNTYQEFKDAAPVIGYYVCNQNSTVPMPQAEQVQNRMWATGARGHLMAAFGLGGACTPVESPPDEPECP
jgi:mono/diheme cytochrome c family protein